MRWGLALTLGILLIGGCGQSPAKPEDAPAGMSAGKSQADPAQDLYEKLHAGAFQADAALESLQSAVEALRPLPESQGGETKDALLNVLDMLDSAARTLAEYTESPTVEEVRQDTAKCSDQRTKMLEELKDALQETREAEGVIDDMIASEPPEKEKAVLETADAGIADAIDALEEGIRLMGGEVPPAETAE